MRKSFFVLLIVVMLLGGTVPIFAQGGPGTKDFAIRDFGACINLPDFTNTLNPDPYNTIFQVPGLFSINFAEYLMPLPTLPNNGDEIYNAMISLLNTVSAGDYQRIGFNHTEYISAAVEFTLDGKRMFGMIYRNQSDKLFFLFADKVAGFDMLAIGRAIFAADAKCTPLNLPPITPQSTTNTSIIPGTGGSAPAVPAIDSANVSLTVNNSTNGSPINSGECVTIEWHIENVQAVYFEGQGVAGHGSIQVCPTSTQTYTILVVKVDGSREERQTTVNVNQSSQQAEYQSPQPGSAPSFSEQDYDVYLALDDLMDREITVCPNERVVLGWWSNTSAPDWVTHQLVARYNNTNHVMTSITSQHIPGSWHFIPSVEFPGMSRVGFLFIPTNIPGHDGSNYIYMNIATACF